MRQTPHRNRFRLTVHRHWPPSGHHQPAQYRKSDRTFSPLLIYVCLLRNEGNGSRCRRLYDTLLRSKEPAID
nr:MAG TPA: hypothetical protein [Caudoviricetes sp.]